MIQVRSLSIKLGEFSLRDVHLSVNRGEYVVIMGPTGSGKTVLLECLVGLYGAESGEVWIGGRRMDGEPPERRGVAYVPQDYCLFPHMTLADNITYGMRLRGTPAEERAQKLQMLSDLLGIGHLLDRRPLHLSGGERQRGALARALAIDPDVLLLDEPLSAVDEYTRDSLCEMLKGLQRKLGITTLHVSHNLDEALAVGDRIAVFGNGTILQEDEPCEVLSRPANSFVARCVGVSNVVPGRGVVEDGQRWFEADGVRLHLRSVPEGPCVLIVRPEHVRPMPPGARDRGPRMEAVVRHRQERGPLVWLDLQMGGLSLKACLPSGAFSPDADSLSAGTRVDVVLPEHEVHFAPN